ncbi:MAG: hypothetical protein K9L59_18150 [Desulfobacterales bacterium]|nr:hypothetical protein [Desulfobacterales bacterium]
MKGPPEDEILGQLSAALVAVQEEVQKMPVMSLDDRRCAAARREGFIVNPP